MPKIKLRKRRVPRFWWAEFVLGLLWCSVVKNPPAKAGDVGSTPGLKRSPGEGNGNPLHCSSLGDPIDRGAWQATVYGITKELDTT